VAKNVILFIGISTKKELYLISAESE
jgi:hypothetical protein